MQSKFKDFVFFYVPGSCGSFLNSLFGYYINHIQTPYLKYKGYINPKTGDCHNNKSYRNKHIAHWGEKIPEGKKVVAIDFDDDDKKFIFRMMFHKSWKYLLTQKMLSDLYNGKYKHLEVSNVVQLEKEMSNNLDDFIFPNWKNQISLVKPELVVTYKQIMFGDLNNIVANFFNVNELLDAQQHIKEYRLYNSKYFVE